jgi:hypothetical protein
MFDSPNARIRDGQYFAGGGLENLTGEADLRVSAFRLCELMNEPSTLTPQQRTRLRELPILIEQERDASTISQLVDELLDLTKLWLKEAHSHDGK